MPVRLYPLRTGSVRIKAAQCARKPGGAFRVLTDSEWSERLPIYSWLIDHPDGLIVVDTGETCRTREAGYFPKWHPYYRWAVEMDVQPEDEIGPRLSAIGLSASEVRTVILTHFHTDHAGGLHHFQKARIWASQTEIEIAQGFLGRMRGYLPHRWPSSLDLRRIPFGSDPFGSFQSGYSVTRSGDVIIVPTPGHTPGHVSVIVRSEGVCYFLAGDASYSERTLIGKIPDGVSLDLRKTIGTLNRILRYAGMEHVVYLPSHDPESVRRLDDKTPLHA